MKSNEPVWVEYNTWVMENGCDYCKKHNGHFCMICAERWVKDQHDKCNRMQRNVNANK